MAADVMVMAKKKTGRPAEPAADERVPVIVLKDYPEYAEWFHYLTQTTLIAGSAIVRDALAKWAAERGLKPPPSPAVRRPGPRSKR